MSSSSLSPVVGKRTPEPALKWVKCESCKKWRTIPAQIDLASLPDQWFCSMNTWNSNFNTCEAPQEEDDEDDEDARVVPEARKKRKRSAASTKEKPKTPRASKTPRVGERASKRSRKDVDYSKGGAGETGGVNMELLEQQEQDAKERAQRRKAKERSMQESTYAAEQAAYQASRRGGGGGGGGETTAAALQWVQCSRCSKWRKLGIGVDPNALPEIWYVS